MLGLQTPIRQLPRMQSPTAKKFEQLGLITVKDALFYFPFRHEDWRRRSQVADVAAGQDVTIEATVAKITSRRSWRRRGTTVVEATVTDNSGGKLKVSWFNLPFLTKTLKVGDQLYLSGTIVLGRDNRLQLQNPLFEKASSDEPLHQKMVPVYRSTEGLSQRQIRLVMKQAVSLANLIPDPLPVGTPTKLGIVTLPEALQHIHFAQSPELGYHAVERLKFDELLAWHLQLLESHDHAQRRTAPTIPFRETEIRSFVQNLPFELTTDQRVAAWQVLQDLARPEPMSRLVQGDVGSGKTVVAALVGYNVALSHFQVALIAPTVVLAEQHWQTLTTMLVGRDVTIALVTGQQAKINDHVVTRPEIISGLAGGAVDIVIGTHALLHPDVVFHQLGLVIVDEQQRFGVEQRQILLDSGQQAPHFLSLTATPIPRSFALWLSGILSVSSIKSKPKNRAVITTKVVGPKQRNQVDQAIAATAAKKEQVYVITPLIEESDSLGVRAATTEHVRLRETYPHLSVGLLHGAMPGMDRVAILDHFRQGQFDILVSTTVIEVGVDVPTATLMVIEGAERFGLAQLHQLRGRVGRSTLPSTCLLVTDQVDPAIMSRLGIVATTTDGFAIAELDLKERGAGDLYGQRQSGLPSWQLASLNDTTLFTKVTAFTQSLNLDERQTIQRKLKQAEGVAAAFHPE